MDNAWIDLARIARAGRRGLLGTLVKGVGPTYRKPGASVVIDDANQVIGAISGGCLESDVLRAAELVLSGQGPAELLEYDTSGEEDLIWGTGSGCGGQVTICVAPVADDLLQFVAGELHANQHVTVATVITPGPLFGRRLAVASGLTVGSLGEPELDRVATEAAAQIAAGQLPPVAVQPSPLEGVELFVQRLPPPPTFLLLGAGDDCVPVARLAAAAGFRVVVVDHRPAWATPERFPWADQVFAGELSEVVHELELPADTHAVLMTHHFERDQANLKLLFGQPIAYVGLLGARQRSRRLLELVLADAPELEEAARRLLRAPVGLDIGADGPEQIAIAVVAELLALRTNRSGSPMAGR